MPSFALKVTRSALSLIAAVSPKLAGRLAFALFCRTPSRKPKGEKARAVHSAGETYLATAEKISLSISNGMAMTYRFNGGGRSNGRRYLVVHGWGSGIAYISQLVRGLAETGAEVVALDLPGHGRSSGRSLNIRMAVEAIAAAERQFGPFDAAIGHSFGGASLMIAAGGVLACVPPVMPKRLVLISAPSEMTWLFKGYGKMMRLSPGVEERLELEALAATGKRPRDFDAIRVLGAYQRPVLVLHAEDDKEVSASHARRYASGGRHVTLEWANGLGHRRIVSAPQTIARIIGFVADSERTLAA
jgi:pimeloyl-ACP methyl ester carboxylesterase